MKTNIYFNVLIGALLVSFLGMGFDFAISGSLMLNNLFWSIFSNALIIVLLGYYISNSRFSGRKLVAVIFLIYYGVGHFNILIEALIFNVTDQAQTLYELFRGLIITLIASPLLAYLFTNRAEVVKPIEFEERSLFSWISKVLLGDFLYLIFYLTAGFILQAVYPELLDFYEGKIPSFGLMIGTQVFVRGFIFIGVALVILRSLELSLIKKGVLVGLIFAVLGGIAPLIQPNDLMPINIRFGHAFEVGISNFLYGMALSYILHQKPNK